MLRGLPAFVVGAALLSGCGGGETQVTPTDLTTYEVASSGFSLAVPSSWRAATADEFAETDEWDAELEQAPILRPSVEALREPDSVIKLVAFDREVQDGFATNVNVVVEQLQAGMTFEKYSTTLVEQLELVPVVVGDIATEEVELSAGRSLRVSYQVKLTTAGETKTVNTVQYVVVVGRAAYTVTYATLPVLADENEHVFADSARTFRLRSS